MTKHEEIPPEDVELCMHVTAWFLPRGHHGQGGIVHKIHDDAVILLSGTAGIMNAVTWDSVHHWTAEVAHKADECLEYHPGGDCSGPVDMWHSGGLGGRSWPRCTFHGERRLERYETSLERYADSDVVPDWFDPADIGERWDDDY